MHAPHGWRLLHEFRFRGKFARSTAVFQFPGCTLWTKSCTALKPSKTRVCWYLHGISIPGFLRWCRLSFIHSMLLVAALEVGYVKWKIPTRSCLDLVPFKQRRFEDFHWPSAHPKGTSGIHFLATKVSFLCQLPLTHCVQSVSCLRSGSPVMFFFDCMKDGMLLL